eukprot:gene32403-43291_t
MSDLTEVHAQSCCRWKCAVVKCSTFKHTLQLSRSDPEVKKESALKSLFINGTNHLNDNVDMPIQHNSSDFAGSDMILLPRHIPTKNKAQPLVLPKASACTAVATCDTLENLCTNQMYNQSEGGRDVRTNPSSTSEEGGTDLSKQVKKRRRKSNISLAKALQEARRIDVLKKREELLHRKAIHRSVSSIVTTTIAVDDNTLSTANAVASRQSGRIGLGSHESNNSLYSYCEGKRNFSKFSLESSTPSKLPHSTPTLSSSSYLPWKVQSAPQAAHRVTLVHPNPRYEPTQEQESYPDPLLESIDLFQHDFVDESESPSGGSEYTWIAGFFENEGLWL